MASKIGPLENMRCGKPAKTTIAETKYADEVRMRPRIYSMAPKVNIDFRTLVTRR